MVPKITTGASIRSSLEYDLASKNGEPGGEWIAGSLSGTARQMARQASLFRSLRTDCSKAIWSVSLSLPPVDGRQSPEKWAAIVHSFLGKMGIEPTRYGWACHRHTHQSDHVHLRLCRVGSDGVLWNQEHSARRAIKACGELEVEFDLNKHSRSPTPKTRPSRAEVQISQKKGIPMSREKIQEQVDQILADHPNGIDFEAFQGLLQAANIEVQAYAPGGDLKGVSYAYDSFKWPGSKLGRQYSAGLVERGVRYSKPATNVITAAPSQQHQALDHPSQQLQPVPQSMYAANQMPAQGAVVLRLAEVGDRLDEMHPAMSATPFLNCSWALAKLLVEAAKMAAALGAALLRFLKHVLSYFGLSTREPLQFQEQPVKPQSTYEPVHHGRVLESDELESLDKNAADAIDHVLECVRLGRPDDLPYDIDGRDQLVAAMTSTAKTGTPTAEEADPMDAMFDDHQTPPLLKPEPRIEPVDTFVLLNTSMAEFVDASIARTEAGKRDTPQVAKARENRELAIRRLKRAKLEYLREKERKGRWAFLLPAEITVIEAEQAEFDQAEKSLATASQQHPSTTPPELLKRHADALANVKASAAQHHAKMLSDVDQHANAKVKSIALYQAQSFRSQLDIFERAPIAGHLYNAVQVAEYAPQSIATALTLAAQEQELAKKQQIFVPDDTRNEDEKDGQK